MQTVSELQARLKDIDESERSHKTPFRKYEHPKKRRRVDKSWIDAIVISHEFTDHCNKETLLEFPSTTPVFATSKAAILIRSWNYFDAVQDVPTFAPQDPDWRKTSIKPLPQWLGISRIVTESDSLYYHSAILITFNLNSGHQRKSSEEAEQGEALIYTPHGIQPRDLCYLPLAKPRVNTLALLHGLHDITINPFKQLNLGAHNGLQAQRTCGAKYWISTHDEVKTGGGVIALFLKRKAISLQQAMEREREEKGDISDESIFADIKGVTFADLGNGESILLE